MLFSYSYGLKIATLSSKKLGDSYEGTLKNNYLYNDKELFDDADLNWYDYGFRNYDPQIGRFTQLDPLTFDYPFYTPYQYAGCEPIANIDVDGLEPEGAVEKALNIALIETANVAGQVCENAIVHAIKPAAKVAAKSANFWSVAGNFFKGIGQSAWGTVKGVVHMVTHPVQTVKSVVHLVTHPVQTVKAIYKIVKKTYNAFKDGDANTRANILGNIGGDITQLFIGTAEAKLAEEAANTGKVIEETTEAVKLVEEAEAVNDLTKIEKLESKTVGHHSDPKFMGGDPKQDLTKILESEHQALHKELNDFLVKYKDGNGNHMRPQSNNSGTRIQNNFSPEERLKAMGDFYKGPGAKYKEAAADFFKQHPGL